MNCNKIQAAVITPVLAAGSVASPYFYEVNITHGFAIRRAQTTLRYSIRSSR